MSRQFDNPAANRFELFGEEHELVKPTKPETLAAAIRVRDLLQQACDALDFNPNIPYFQLLNTQQELIDEYISDLGEFDNRILTANINYLTKSLNIRIGDLEKLLGISPGYISRTAKNNSGKKMSIDNVWRIARLFKLELSVLLEIDLQCLSTNTTLLVRFLEKLRRQTEDNEIMWHNCGGSSCDLEKRFRRLPQFRSNRFNDDDDVCYQADHLNPNRKFVLADDIYSTKDVEHGREIVMIAYIPAGANDIEGKYHIDFYFLSTDPIDPSDCKLIKMFYTLDDHFGTLDTYASQLMSSVQFQEADTPLTPDIKNLITSYLD